LKYGGLVIEAPSGSTLSVLAIGSFWGC